MKNIYLPDLIKISINNYTLYRQESSFEYEFRNGSNAVIGVNGIGKTTFVNMIIYCLVGHKRKENKQTKNSKKPEFEYTDEDFFSSRLDISSNDDENLSAEVQLSYMLGTNSIIVTRSLIENKIILLQVNNTVFENASEKDYENMVEKCSNITHFSDFYMLIREFLFFDERRSNIAWEANSQDNILRILLLEEEYHLKINELEEKMTKADSKGRHASEDKRVAEASYKELIAEKDKVVRQSTIVKDLGTDEVVDATETKRQNFVAAKNEISSILIEKREQLNSLQEEYDEMIRNLSQTEGELTNISVTYDNTISEIKKIETVLYRSIYNNLPDYYFTIEKNMISEGKCLICNTKSKEIQKRAIIQKQNNECFICSSKFKETLPVDTSLIDKLNDLNVLKVDRLNTVNNLKNKVYKQKEAENLCKGKIEQLILEINELERNIVVIESELNKIEPNKKKKDLYTEILQNKEKLISELEKTIRESYRERDKYKEDLSVYTQKFKNVINGINKNLSDYFNKYASTFMGMDCRLSMTTKKENKISHYYYVPEIDGQVRKDIWSVSESQRFFIDQAFRMAIIDYLQNNIDNFRTFFITETPEGSLDIAYESQVANMFWIFSTSNNKIIFTSNLNSSNFLKELYKNIPKKDRESRTLNLLKKGKITQVQKNKYEYLEKILSEVMEI